MMIREVHADLFELGVDALAHGCNVEGVMNAGIAKAFRHRYPEMFKEYQAYCKAGLFEPGQVHFYRSRDGLPHVVNIATQADREGARLEYVAEGLRNVERHYRDWQISSLALPQFGCGLGGLEWREVRKVLYEVFKGSGLEVTVALR